MYISYKVHGSYTPDAWEKLGAVLNTLGESPILNAVAAGADVLCLHGSTRGEDNRPVHFIRQVRPIPAEHREVKLSFKNYDSGPKVLPVVATVPGFSVHSGVFMLSFLMAASVLRDTDWLKQSPSANKLSIGTKPIEIDTELDSYDADTAWQAARAALAAQGSDLYERFTLKDAIRLFEFALVCPVRRADRPPLRSAFLPYT